jgi:hypothetical protein
MTTRFMGNSCRPGYWANMSAYFLFRTPVSAYKPSYIHCPGTEPLLSLTLGQLAQKAAEQWGERIAFVSVYEKQHYTFREMLDKVMCFVFHIFELCGLATYCNYCIVL